MTLEESSHASIHPFLASIAEPTPILLRSTTKGKGKETSPPRMEPENVLPHTPLSELTTSGLETEQIWEQLELRAPGYIKVAKEIISAGGRQPIDEDEEAMENEEEEEGIEDDDMDEEEFRKMLEDGELGDMTDEQFEEMMKKAEEEDEEDDESGSDLSDDEDESDGDEDDEGDSLEGSDEDGEIEFEDGTKIGDSDDDLLDEDDDEEEEEDEDEDEDVEMGSDEEPSHDDAEDEEGEQAGPSRRRRHPTLDDQFFSIDDFNRMTEEAEATSLSSGRLDDDEEEELDEDVGQLMLNGVGDDEGMSPTSPFKDHAADSRNNVWRFL